MHKLCLNSALIKSAINVQSQSQLVSIYCNIVAIIIHVHVFLLVHCLLQSCLVTPVVDWRKLNLPVCTYMCNVYIKPYSYLLCVWEPPSNLLRDILCVRQHLIYLENIKYPFKTEIPFPCTTQVLFNFIPV